MNPSLLRLKLLQAVTDGLLILAAFAGAYFLRIGFHLEPRFPFLIWNGYFFSGDFPFKPYFTVALLTLPVTLLTLFFSRAYRLSQQVLSWRHAQRIAYVAIVNVAVFMVIYYFTYREFFSRLILVFIGALTFGLVFLSHLLFRWILQKCSEREVGVYRVLILGTNRPAQAMVRMLVETRSHLKPVAVIDPGGSQKSMIAGVPVVGKMNRFEKTVAEYRIDTILQTDHLEQSINVINYALSNHLRYFMPPELLGIFQGHQTLEEIEGMAFLKVMPKKRWWHSLW